MIVVKPALLGPDQLISTTAVDEYPEWAAGSYDQADRVVHGLAAWEALQDGVTSVPGEDPLDWLRLGYSNRNRMFFDGRDSPTTAEGSLDVVMLSPEILTTFAALGLTGATAKLTITDPAEGVVYEREESLVDIGVPDFWEWHFMPYDRIDTVVFDGIPPYAGAEVELSVEAATAEGQAAVGRVIAGVETHLGCALYGTSVELLDFSTRERDPFGNLTLIKRRAVNLIDYDVSYPSHRFDFIVRTLGALASEPTLFIGSKDKYRTTIAFGVFRSAIPTITSPSVSEMTLQVEEF